MQLWKYFISFLHLCSQFILHFTSKIMIYFSEYSVGFIAGDGHTAALSLEIYTSSVIHELLHMQSYIETYIHRERDEHKLSNKWFIDYYSHMVVKFYCFWGILLWILQKFWRQKLLSNDNRQANKQMMMLSWNIEHNRKYSVFFFLLLKARML